MVRVLITEDSPTMENIMRRIMESDPEIRVVGWAKNGLESVNMAMALKPDVITMDIQMPVMDGFEATKRIMNKTPTSILIVSSMLNEDISNSFNALKMGALDVLGKPKLLRGASLEHMGEELIQRIKTVAKVSPLINISTISNEIVKSPLRKRVIPMMEDSILAIGASTGGPAALSHILKGIPRRFHCPILITQHIHNGFLDGLVDWLDKSCSLKVKAGKNNEKINNGTIYIAPDNYHMGVTIDQKILLSNEGPVSGHRPSINFLMESVASVYGKQSMGVILTGMGNDGASGLMAIRHEGGITISQDEATSVIYGMPKAAVENGAAIKICPIDDISDEIIQWESLSR